MESRAAILYEPDPNPHMSESRPAKLETIEVAEPTGEEVLVEIGAASLCHTDVSMALGENTEPLPLVMGHEGAGVVRDVGEDVEDVEPGDHVVLGRIACGKCEYCRAGKSNLCANRRKFQNRGSLRTGDVRFSKDGDPLHHCHGVSSFTEYTIVTDEVAIPITDEIPLEEATLLGCGVFTGAGAVMSTADIDPGASVALFGMGGVGLSALQAATIRGAGDIIAVDLVPEKLEKAASLGADYTVNPEDGDPVEQVREITDGGADYTFDLVGVPQVAQQALDSVAKDGDVVLVGTSPEGTHDIGIDLRDVVLAEKSLYGSFNGSYNLPLAIPKLAEYVASGDFSLTEMISDQRPMDELNEAMETLETGTAFRQVIVP